MKQKIEITKTQNPRTKPAFDKLGFGQYFSDHMFMLNYEGGTWSHPRITPYSSFMMEPGASVFHYGQALFEGLKAFKGNSNKIHLFRPDFHVKRMAVGSERLCMPAPPADICS